MFLEKVAELFKDFFFVFAVDSAGFDFFDYVIFAVLGVFDFA